MSLLFYYIHRLTQIYVMWRGKPDLDFISNIGPLLRADDCFHRNEFLSYGPTIPLMTTFMFSFVHRTECQSLTRMVSASCFTLH